MATNSNAEQAEINAYKLLLKKLGLTSKDAWAAPAGFSTDFPDFGFTLQVGTKKVDLWIEYKADAKAQMGSMRDWIFDGTKYTSSERGYTDEKQMLVDLMNTSPDAIKNGKRLLNDLKKYFNPSIRLLNSGVLTVEKDQVVRRQKLINFVNNTKNYQIANIDNSQLGQGIIKHYKKKFNSMGGSRGKADYSMLLMMIGNELWFVDERGQISSKEQQQILDMMGARSLPVLSNLKAKLEVRIQPRGLNSPGKAVSIDVMASFRLSSKPSAGHRIA